MVLKQIKKDIEKEKALVKKEKKVVKVKVLKRKQLKEKTASERLKELRRLLRIEKRKATAARLQRARLKNIRQVRRLQEAKRKVEQERLKRLREVRSANVTPLQAFFGKEESNKVKVRNITKGIDGKQVRPRVNKKFNNPVIDNDIDSFQKSANRGLAIEENLFGNEQIFLDERINEQIFPRRLSDV